MEPSIFNNIYQSYWAELCDKIRYKFGSGPPDPEDIAQQAFIRFSEYKTDKPIQNPKALIYTIARNLVIDAHRSMQRQNNMLEDIFNELELAPLEQISTEQAVLEQEKVDVVSRAVSGLNAKQQKLLFETRIEGKTYQMLSDSLGYSVADICRTLEKANLVITQALMEWESQSSSVEIKPELSRKTL
ncbi:sigma-70 family RNA polymerase sigma factor [Catenovulum sp. 2E275]|uniref:RNA polymerase sigma factor n=1 Tax=Catenovulum sp. 2E275 TaxID=2980497 RepID=UPI0021CE127D|nr:sigma-70 family RNA polymerase sigma factor [Catenovulum sp. 2E275]MCU4675030.1 sigma-70 family RNA polymerase sigma factor [Catenovulum sp. 2E275]